MNRKPKRDHAPGKLTALAISKIRSPGRYYDGGGLYLLAQQRANGKGLTMSWVCRYQINGKRRAMGLGAFPAVSMAKARADAADIVSRARGQYDTTVGQRVRIDPLAIKRDVRVEQRTVERLAAWTFERVASEVHTMLAPGWRNPKHAAQWISSLQTYAFPLIGEKPVGAIEVADVLEVLKPIWHEKSETARRVRQRMDQCMKWAMAHKYATGNPVEAAAVLLGEQKDDVQHHRAVAVADAVTVYAQIAEAPGIGARALQWAILTAARSGEARGALWSEIDTEAKLWRIPAERMKAGKAHAVPLSDAAIKLLVSIERRESVELVFANEDGEQLSDMTLVAVHRRLEIDAVPHGWRSTFRDWCAQNAVPREVAERSLAHVVANQTEAAYNRTDLIEQRRPVMMRWARFVTGTSGAKVVKLAGAER